MNQEQPHYCIKHKPQRLTLISLGTGDRADYSVFMVQKWKDIVSLSLTQIHNKSSKSKIY